MNQGQFAGYLGKDAVLRSTPSGHSVLNFSVGVSVGFGDQKKTLWVACALWGERAEKLEQYLTKGQAVSVSGDIDINAYKTRDGEAGAELKLNVQRLTLQGGKRDKESSRAAPAERAARSAAPAEQSGKEDFDDDIPF